MKNNFDAVINFLYQRNKTWREKITREQLAGFLKENSNNVLIILLRERIIAVGIFIDCAGERVFISVTIDKTVNGFKLIRDFVRRNKVSWLTKSMELRQCRK